MLLPLLLLPSCLCLSLVVLLPGAASAQKLKPVYEWRWIDYQWDRPADRAAAIKSGDYDYTKPIIIDADLAKDGRVFVTIIRRDGVPASLATVSSRSGDGGPLLKPYPNWKWAKKGDCDAITDVYRVAIDECNRLWVIDNGKINGERVCQPQLLAFDLSTDRLIRRVKIPDNVAFNEKTGEGLLITPIVETEGRRCERTHVYIADVLGHGLVIYNGTALWRLDSSVYSDQPFSADVEIAGESFNLPDGVLGMALSPKGRFSPRHLMFRPFASFDMMSSETWNLQNSNSGTPVEYRVAANALPSQAVAMAFSSKGVLFFGLTVETAVGCWNMNKPISRPNIVLADRNPVTHQFASGMKVIPKEITGDSEQLWMVTNRYQKIAADTQNFSEVNFRIQAGRVDDLIANNNCSPSKTNYNDDIYFEHKNSPRDSSPGFRRHK